MEFISENCIVKSRLRKQCYALFFFFFLSRKKHRFGGIRQVWVLKTAVSLPACMTVGQLFTILELQFPHLT